MAETRLDRVLKGRDWTRTSDLVRLLEADGCSRTNAYVTVGQAFRRGVIERRGAPTMRSQGYEYRLVPGRTPWNRMRAKLPDAERHSGQDTHYGAHITAQPYVGPAFDRGPLCPAIASRDPEVMPPEVADLIDSLHQRFYREATGVE